MQADNQLVLRPHPFTLNPGVVMVRAGQTLQQMLSHAAGDHEVVHTLRVEIGGYEVPRSIWAHVRPKQGVAIHATVMPASGGVKKVIRTVLLVAVAAAAMWVTGGGASVLFGSAFGAGTFGALALGAAVSIIGSLLVNALIPPPKPGGAGAASEIGRWNALTGSSNQANPYGPIPFVIGEAKIYPPHAAMPFSEMVGPVSYQRLMFDLGHGELDVSDLKIGDTDLSEFEGVEYEITKTPTLYTDDVNETAISAAMNDSDDVNRTTEPVIDEISLDIVFPQGLFGLNDDGKQVSVTANLTIEYRATGDVTWLPVPAPGDTTGGVLARAHGMAYVSGGNFTVKTPDRKPFAVSYAFGVDQGQYDIRVTRAATTWGSANSNSRIGDAVWATLRSIKHTDPSRTNTNKLVMRIKASEQLNGTLSTLSCVVRQKIAVYDADTETWAAPAYNTNTAWVYYWLLTTCEAITTHVDPSRIDLDNLVEYAEFCSDNDFETRGVVDSRTTARALIDDVLACALGAVSLRDGKYGVIFDDGVEDVPSMAFTPLDMKGLTVQRMFGRLPHAFKMRFRNPAAFWETDEIIVLDDGYSYRGVDARGDASADPEPTEFEVIEVRMACDAHQAWRIGRAHFAQAKFRPSVYSWETDIANLACTRGDLVMVSHDVTEWGAGWGRVISIDGTTVTLDEIISVPAGVTYSMRFRLNDGTNISFGVTPHSIETNTFYVDATPTGVNIGDTAVVGESERVSEPLLVTGIYPSGDLSARISAVAYSDQVGPYWADPPAVIYSDITGTAFLDPPPAPNITVVLTDLINDEPDDAGIYSPSVRFLVNDESNYLEPVYYAVPLQ